MKKHEWLKMLDDLITKLERAAMSEDNPTIKGECEAMVLKLKEIYYNV